MANCSRMLRKESRNQQLFFLALLLLHTQLQISASIIESTTAVYIVYLGERQHQDPTTTRKFHHELLLNLLGSKEAARCSLLYSYRHGFSGFAARLTKSQAQQIEEMPGVVQVIANRIHKLHTTRSWDFLGLNLQPASDLLSASNLGEETIIGVIDSGIWPELESFNDRNMGPIPSRWKGICQHGEQFDSTNCNRKLIGARWFVKGMQEGTKKSINTTKSGEYLSPRDGIGHGTHTASTAAGRYVERASYNGLAFGVARGGAPLARIVMYKACWAIGDEGCSDADLLKAFDKAIYDGVDILSVSIGIEVPLFSYVNQHDSIAIGAFHATAKGITVVCSAGNDGPFSQTIVNTAPWLITVAATTIDRAFPTAITLGNNHTLLGQSMDTTNHVGFVGLVYSERIAINPTDDSSKACKPGSLDEKLAAGKVVLCFSVTDEPDIVNAAFAVQQAGGVGLIYAQFRDNLLIVKLGHPSTAVGKWVSPKVAYFSSRGPSSLSPAVLKPDIAAPGVSILAAFPPSNNPEHSREFYLESGTSMACPHVTGVAALIKSLHPDWSPAAIKSALVTTASHIATDRQNIIAEGSTRKPADPFDIGGGHVDPRRAANPGLIYNMSTDDYVQFLCSLGYSISAITNLTMNTASCIKKRHFGMDLNLPSISIPNLITTVTISRTLTNVGPTNSVYKALMQPPYGVKMAVQPQTLIFNSSTGVLSFTVTFSSIRKLHGDYTFGSLTWSDEEHIVRIPVAVRAILFESYADI
ncbi:hypothetical protein Sjap_005734 [Stephania japonica]|uniref:Uncharacterized protein n=1 Tax=Stephania japonica TaxID=461633 RepID=A0AAP0K4J4_9MAGN